MHLPNRTNRRPTLRRFTSFVLLCGISRAATVVGAPAAGAPVPTGAPTVELWRVVAVCDKGPKPEPHAFSFCDRQLRIEPLRPPGPVHWNLVDVATDTVTVVYPHNQSFEVLPARPAPPPAVAPAAPAIRPAATGTAATGLDAAELATLPADLRDRLIASLSSAPSRPESLPALSAGFPPAANLPVADGPPPTLEPQADAPRTLQGLTCRRYLLRGPGEPLEIWATADGPFPFHQMIRERGGYGPRDPRDSWVEVARNAGLFPLEVRTAGAAPRTLFAIVSLRSERIAVGETRKLFAVPAGYRAIETPDFARNR